MLAKTVCFRSGKMLGPKYGLLSVVVDNYLEGRVHDTAAVPIRLLYCNLYNVYFTPINKLANR